MRPFHRNDYAFAPYRVCTIVRICDLMYSSTMDFESETFFACPYCAQQISMVLEELYGPQAYIEDCEVCCNPIQISYDVEDGMITEFAVEKAQ